MEKAKLPKRKPTRLQGFDYNSGGAYFLTVCTKNRQPILSAVVGRDVHDAPQVELSPFGKVVKQQLLEMDAVYENITVDAFAVMPDHVHILLRVEENPDGFCGASRTSRPTRQHAAVSRFVSTFKRFCNKKYGENIWQDHFNDHIIRSREDYDKHWQYIDENPLRSQLHKHQPTHNK